MGFSYFGAFYFGKSSGALISVIVGGEPPEFFLTGSLSIVYNLVPGVVDSSVIKVDSSTYYVDDATGGIVPEFNLTN